MTKKKKFNGKKHRINNEIRTHKVMLVGDNVKRDYYTHNEALKIADDLDLDLVEMSITKDNISICKVMDYQKYLYNQKKNQKKPDRIVTKEIRFKPFIEDADFQRKKQQAIKFLKKGNKVKLDCLFMGRGWENKRDRILELTYTLLNDITDIGIPEQMPKVEGKKMICIIKPKNKK